MGGYAEGVMSRSRRSDRRLAPRSGPAARRLAAALATISLAALGAGPPPVIPPRADAAAVAAAPAAAVPLDAVTAPDAEFRRRWNLDPRHARMVLVEGFPILGSAAVPDAAFREAAHVIRRMVQGRPELLEPIVAARIRLVLMDHDEVTTDVPEHADLEPAAYWDRRARGLGATTVRPAVSCGVENLLSYPGDPYDGESILVHEFAHVIHQFGMAGLDPEFDRRLEQAYQAAMVAGRWAGTYASTNRHEYFAEGVQSFFDTNRSDDSEHGPVDTRAELAEHDPALLALLEDALGENPWRYRPVTERLDEPHLAGFDPAAAPRFAWSPEVLAAWEAHRREQRATPTRLTLTAAGPASPPPASTAAGAAGRLRFVNRRAESLRLVWVDTLGQFREYGWVRAAGEHEQPTYAGHTWMLLDAENRPVAWVIAAAGPGVVEIPAGP